MSHARPIAAFAQQQRRWPAQAAAGSSSVSISGWTLAG
jgi:hypothetical protein